MFCLVSQKNTVAGKEVKCGFLEQHLNDLVSDYYSFFCILDYISSTFCCRWNGVLKNTVLLPLLICRAVSYSWNGVSFKKNLYNHIKDYLVMHTDKKALWVRLFILLFYNFCSFTFVPCADVYRLKKVT